jgi:hypothetical protein
VLEFHVPFGAIHMEMTETHEARRVWVRPVLQAQSTLTTVTQLASPVPMSLLFLQVSTQCFDGHGAPTLCP